MSENLKLRTKQFSIRIINLSESIPNTLAGATIAKQIIRSGTSVAANYRAACRARSNAEFIAKLGIVEEECDETIFWLEIITELPLLKPELLVKIKQEGEEILSIIIASKKTARKNTKK